MLCAYISYSVLIVLCVLQCIYSNDLSSIKPEEIAIVQYDSRKPMTDYWLASAQWNKYYCDKHGHKYIYFTSKYDSDNDLKWCEKDVLASPWCKVKAMVQADADYKNVKLFLYMDSDAVIARKFETVPLNSLINLMYNKLKWDYNKKPIVFNQDGPCWWCRLIEKVGYSMCLNAGTVLWYRSPISTKILNDWWMSAMDPYEGNPIRRKFRIKWPWEQDRQMAIFNRSSEYIQIASQPEKSVMDLKAGVKDWCLSHLPESGCFVAHYCAYQSSKPRLIEYYQTPREYEKRITKENPYGFQIVKLR